MRGQRRARDVPVQYSTVPVSYCTGKKTPVPYSAGTVPVRYRTVPVPVKRYRGEPGHTRDTRAPVYRSCTADGVQKWQALSGAQFSSVSVQGERVHLAREKEVDAAC